MSTGWSNGARLALSLVVNVEEGAEQSIRDGDSEIVIAGGQESMSMSPHVLQNSRNGQRMGDWKMIDTMITDGRLDESTICFVVSISFWFVKYT